MEENTGKNTVIFFNKNHLKLKKPAFTGFCFDYHTCINVQLDHYTVI